jgi:hypothetical protein
MNDLLREGYFACDKRMNIIKKLDTQVVANEDDKKVQKVYGTWAGEEGNIIKFYPGKKVWLTEDIVALPHVTQLIERGVLKRVY